MPRKRSPIPWLKERHGVYYVYWYDESAKPNPRTKRISLGTSDAVEAQQRYAAFLAKGHASFGPGGTAGLTVTQALDDYWREHVTKNVVSLDRAEIIIRHLKAWFGNTLFRDIDIPACRNYGDARRMGVVGTTEATDSTIRRELGVLQAAANHAGKWRRIGPSADPPSPMPSIELPNERAQGPIHEDDWLTKDELRRAIAACEPHSRLQDFIRIVYDTASRRGAIEMMTRFQVDLRTNTVNLTSPNENENERRSKKRRPVVPISPEVRPVYARLLLALDNECPWLFGSPSDMYVPFRKHMESIGLGHKRNPHILRHSRATHLLQDGVSLWNVSKLLGDTVATVEKVYGHHSPAHLAEVISGTSR